MRVLVTGGLGFIGSHTVLELLRNKHEVVIIDALYNSEKRILSEISKLSGEIIPFIKLDVSDQELENVFLKYKFDAVIHFAGLKAVGESVALPLAYYRNNLLSTINLTELCIKFFVNNIIFSSSATVYGCNQSPMHENMELLPSTNPYGETKVISERILTDAAKANPQLNVTLLRYFNPIGAHESGLIGEKPSGIPNNLIPYITQVAAGLRQNLNVYGNDYDTPDGTGIRDYIHVMDLAEAHVVALEKIKPGINVYNVGTGVGYSVLDVIKTFEEVNNVKIPYKIVDRRSGDLAVVFADSSKIEKELGWKAKKGLEEMVKDAWNFEKKQRGIQ